MRMWSTFNFGCQTACEGRGEKSKSDLLIVALSLIAKPWVLGVSY